MSPPIFFLDPILDPRLFLAFFLPFLISLLGTAAMLRWAPALRLLDIPNERKIHSRPIATGGGLAIFAAWAVTVCLPWFQFEGVWVISGAALIIMVLGLADDLRPLSWQFRLGVQTVTALATLAFLALLPDTHYSFLLTHYFFWPLALLWIIGLVNAFNMLDNMDALSAGVAWIAAALFVAALSWVSPNHTTQPSFRLAFPFLALMGALTGFLWFNRPPARIFMGDAGSTFVGFFLGIASLPGGLTGGEISGTWIIAICILALPWYDLTSVIFLRWRQGRSPFRADKQHLSHRLVNLGLSPPAAVAVIYLLALAIGGGALLLYHGAGQSSLCAVLYLICWWIGLALFEYWTRRNQELRINN